jgi:hypothetical protein
MNVQVGPARSNILTKSFERMVLMKLLSTKLEILQGFTRWLYRGFAFPDPGNHELGPN